MNFLLDTCTFLWVAEASPRLSARARTAFLSPGNRFFLSTVSVAEICIKVGRGRLHLHSPPKKFVHYEQSENKLISLDFTQDHAYHLATLPHIHKDPFDRMLICQALEHQLTILTPDPLIQQYQVPTA